MFNDYTLILDGDCTGFDTYMDGNFAGFDTYLDGVLVLILI